MSESHFLDLRDITISYGAQKAVEDVSVAVEQGQLLALLGPSGCGKTTLMRAIAGLLPLTHGTMTLAGRDLTRVPANRREIGLVFQSYALFPHLTVFDNVAFGLKLRRLDRNEIEERTKSAIAMVGLTGLEHRLPRELSGGQQQRVALARSIVVRPRLLLLDEPLSNLDARLRLDMRSQLHRLHHDLGITMIYVTHDQAEALALADRIVVMRAGHIIQTGSPEDLYERPQTGFVARFMGFENVLRVTDTGLASDEGSLLVDTQSVKSAYALAWRPHQVQLGQGQFRGKILGASYQGDTIEYLLDTAAGHLKVQSPASSPRYQAGQEIAFDLPLQQAISLRAD